MKQIFDCQTISLEDRIVAHLKNGAYGVEGEVVSYMLNPVTVGLADILVVKDKWNNIHDLDFVRFDVYKQLTVLESK